MNELRMNKELFTIDSYERLSIHADKTEHLRSFNKELVEYVYEGFQLYWLWNQDELVGYALIDEVLGGFFYEMDHHQDIIEVVDEENLYSYLAYLEIFEGKQKKGYGASFLELLREHYSVYDMIVCTTNESVSFWLKQGFVEVNQTDKWLKYSRS